MKNFNKLDLKELSRGDVHPNMGRKQLKVMEEMDGIFSKKGTVFTCKPCQFVTPDVRSMMNHIKNNHADLLSGNDSWSWTKFNAKKTIRTCLEQMCDPSLQIEDVVIPNDTRKKFTKEKESNIYEEAATLVSKVIDVRTSQAGKRRFYVDSIAVSLFGWSKQIQNKSSPNRETAAVTPPTLMRNFQWASTQ